MIDNSNWSPPEEGIGQNSEEDIFVLPASFAQQRLWFIEQLFPGDSLYVIPLVFRLTGKLAQSCLLHSIQTIIQRHEVLRTSFAQVEGQLMQVVAPHRSINLQVADLRDSAPDLRDDLALQQIWAAIQQPFDLGQGPLFRVHLWQLQDNEHLLLLTLHHIIFDEWSSGVLIRELGQLYATLVENRPVVLPELPIQYADFAAWQRQWLQGEPLNQQLRYWQQQLQDLPVLNLPGAERTAGQHRGASLLLELPQSLLEDLEALSQQAGVTLFMTLLAAFQTLLYRYTGQTDIAVGSPIANRHRSELEGLIGFLVNSLVLRTDLSGEPTFYQLLERVRDVTLAAYTHQDLPFEKLVEALQPVRNLDHNPLFQVVFALQNTPMEQLKLPGLVLSPVELETQTARFDLELYLWKCADNFRNLWGKGWQQSDGLRGLIIYNSELLDHQTVTGLGQQFHCLLEAIAATPDSPLSALPLLTAQTRQTLLQNWQNAAPGPAASASIQALFEAQAERTPEAMALRAGEQQFSYRDLNQGSNQLARYLQRLGVEAGTAIGICLEPGAEAIAAMLAILKAGCWYVPLDPHHPVERLQFILADAGIQVLLTQSQWASLLPSPQPFTQTIICLDRDWDGVMQEAEQNLPPVATADQPAADQPAYAIYTSGSTGTPKGVVVPHRAVVRLVRQPNYVTIEPGDRVGQVANLAFDAATFEIWGALLNGAQLVTIDRETVLSPQDFAICLQQHQVNILFLTTALFNQTVTQVPTAFRSLTYLLFGGEMANVDAVRLLQSAKPQHVIHVYGPTENTTFSTWYEVQSVAASATTIPIGQAITNTEVYLLDAHLKPVPAHVVGEIYLGGAGLASGYLNQPTLTAERFIQVDWQTSAAGNSSDPKPTRLYKTGDRAFYRSDGNLEFLGRTDAQIKLRGFRVELGEIEAILAQHPAVQTAVVVMLALDASEDNRQLVAYVVPQPGAEESGANERTLRAFLKPKLPDYMLPTTWVLLDRLPLTPNGKVDLKALPWPDWEPAPGTPISLAPTLAPTTSLETTLVELWSQLLGRKSIGVHDNFFELGGHSLLATQFVSRIRDRLQVELPLRTLFETPTIAALSEQITALQSVPAATAAIPSGHLLREEVEL